MPVTRYLGAAWASVHGPAAGLPIWVLDHGFSGLLPGPAARPLDWRVMRREIEGLPFDFAGTWRLAAPGEAEDRPDRDLGSRNRGDVDRALTTIGAAVDRARTLGLLRMILEPGAVRLVGDAAPLDLGDSALGWTAERAAVQVARREAAMDGALDAACRALYRICRSAPDVEFCLTASQSVAGVGTPAGLAAIFEDLAGRKLGYWHEAAVTACRQERLGEPQGEWLERFASRLRGLTASDWADGRLHLPPGSGLVDYPLVANYLPLLAGDFPVVVELDPAVPADEVQGVHSFLDKFGL